MELSGGLIQSCKVDMNFWVSDGKSYCPSSNPQNIAQSYC